MSQTVHFQGNPVTVANSIPQAGSKAQTFTLVAKDLSDVTLGQFAGKRKVLNIFPSIDTGVCAASVRKFNQLATEIDNTVVLCISADLPFAQSRFCGAEGLNNVITLSTFRNAEFLQAYGVAIADGPLKGLAAEQQFASTEQSAHPGGGNSATPGHTRSHCGQPDGLLHLVAHGGG